MAGKHFIMYSSCCYSCVNTWCVGLQGCKMCCCHSSTGWCHAVAVSTGGQLGKHLLAQRPCGSAARCCALTWLLYKLLPQFYTAPRPYMPSMHVWVCSLSDMASWRLQSACRAQLSTVSSASSRCYCNHFVCLQTDVLLADVMGQGLLDQATQAQQLIAQVCKFVRKSADISPDTTGTAANALLCKV